MKYGVMLRGENFAIKSESGVENLGFMATRFVQASSPAEAELIAVELIRKDVTLLEILRKESNSESKIYLEEMWRVGWWRRLGGRGFSFYPME